MCQWPYAPGRKERRWIGPWECVLSQQPKSPRCVTFGLFKSGYFGVGVTGGTSGSADRLAFEPRQQHEPGPEAGFSWTCLLRCAASPEASSDLGRDACSPQQPCFGAASLMWVLVLITASLSRLVGSPIASS